MKPDAYIESLTRLLELHARLTRDGHNIANLNIGGGYGIDYEHGRNPMDIAALARCVGKLVKHLGTRLILEPGRSITGPAGFFITRVEYVKKGNGKSFAIVDGGMNDLIRPALYSAFHRIVPASSRKGARKTNYDIVGPICESGDFLGKDRRLPELRAGDLLVVCDAGAYGMVMASNYNSRPRAAEVMVRGRKHFLVRRRESFKDLIKHEVVPDFLR